MNQAVVAATETPAGREATSRPRVGAPGSRRRSVDELGQEMITPESLDERTGPHACP
jgi:hypothetical protein